MLYSWTCLILLLLISIQLLFSLKVRHLTTCVEWLNYNFRDLSLFKRFNTKITSRNEEDNAIDSASVVIKETIVYILDAHIIGQHLYIITYPYHECADRSSLKELSFHDPSQSATTKHSRPRDLSGLNTRPLSFVLNK